MGTAVALEEKTAVAVRKIVLPAAGTAAVQMTRMPVIVHRIVRRRTVGMVAVTEPKLVTRVQLIAPGTEVAVVTTPATAMPAKILARVHRIAGRHRQKTVSMVMTTIVTT